MNERALYRSVFALMEHLGEMRLTDTSKRQIMTHLQEAKAESTAAKARATIRRYVTHEIPTLDDIRVRSQQGALTLLDHLVLKMEHVAARVHATAP